MRGLLLRSEFGLEDSDRHLGFCFFFSIERGGHLLSHLRRWADDAKIGSLPDVGDLEGPRFLQMAAEQHGNQACKACEHVEEARPSPVGFVKQGRLEGSQASEYGKADVVGQADAGVSDLSGEHLDDEMEQDGTCQGSQQPEAKAEG
eukprot:CAMPEP_0195001272 /NCGR_PEP_ID=MMETSP0326_2-20130528/1205_1 /TAXON_ID=2866 ORGANISM="Crypthecodinium cohnii, Strain Seligo" /NCGR_SAMPLE_ID=MMETSP0326_2 /ASSEMBLY_ACC=CAM_ASM_000348 /LENGTH=146 /DNA_ID=CAMNT_0040003625 /DNA_START=466 /DNA_END=906 /DNA_ORIENTATION=+